MFLIRAVIFLYYNENKSVCVFVCPSVCPSDPSFSFLFILNSSVCMYVQALRSLFCKKVSRTLFKSKSPIILKCT